MQAITNNITPRAPINATETIIIKNEIAIDNDPKIIFCTIVNISYVLLLRKYK